MNTQQLLRLFINAPESQIDPQYTFRIEKLADKPEIKSDELLAVIDDMVYTSGCSDFVIQALNAVWLRLVDEEGMTPTEALGKRDPALRDTKLD